MPPAPSTATVWPALKRRSLKERAIRSSSLCGRPSKRGMCSSSSVGASAMARFYAGTPKAPRRLLERGAAPLDHQRRRASQPLVRLPQARDLQLERTPGAAAEAAAGTLESLVELAEIRNDKPYRRRWRRCADIRGEVAERGVLLVADRGNDRDREGGDCTDEPFVAEGQEILEAAAAAGDDDDVELRHFAEAAQRVHDGARGARALDVG